jgi:hypothetical protein
MAFPVKASDYSGVLVEGCAMNETHWRHQRGASGLTRERIVCHSKATDNGSYRPKRSVMINAHAYGVL